MRATFRETPEREPIECDVLGERKGHLICREVGKPLAGVWAARRDQIGPPLDADTIDFGIWLRANLQALGAL